MRDNDAAAFPKRKHLRRLTTVFEKWRAPLFYLTLCVRHRRKVLCSPAIRGILIGAWRESLPLYGWMVGRYVIMPDHVHFFVSPSTEQAKELSNFVGSWKNWTQQEIRKSGISSFAW